MRNKYDITQDETVSVPDLPREAEFTPWTGWACPFAGMLPEGIELLKREDQRGVALAVRAKKIDKYIAWNSTSKDLIGELWNREISVACSQLALLLFDKEFPGQYAEYLKMRVKAISLHLHADSLPQDESEA